MSALKQEARVGASRRREAITRSDAQKHHWPTNRHRRLRFRARVGRFQPKVSRARSWNPPLRLKPLSLWPQARQVGSSLKASGFINIQTDQTEVRTLAPFPI